MTGASPGNDRWAPLTRSPQLRTGEERSASRLELFFDLAYVLVVAELAAVLGKDLSWHGALVFAGLFTVTWWSWVTTTLYANRFDTNGVVYRLAKLAGTVAVMGMAASAAGATGEEPVVAAGVGFVASVSVVAGALVVTVPTGVREQHAGRPDTTETWHGSSGRVRRDDPATTATEEGAAHEMDDIGTRPRAYPTGG